MCFNVIGASRCRQTVFSFGTARRLCIGIQMLRVCRADEEGRNVCTLSHISFRGDLFSVAKCSLAAAQCSASSAAAPHRRRADGHLLQVIHWLGADRTTWTITSLRCVLGFFIALLTEQLEGRERRGDAQQRGRRSDSSPRPLQRGQRLCTHTELLGRPWIMALKKRKNKWWIRYVNGVYSGLKTHPSIQVSWKSIQ